MWFLSNANVTTWYGQPTGHFDDILLHTQMRNLNGACLCVYACKMCVQMFVSDWMSLTFLHLEKKPKQKHNCYETRSVINKVQRLAYPISFTVHEQLWTCSSINRLSKGELSKLLCTQNYSLFQHTKHQVPVFFSKLTSAMHYCSLFYKLYQRYSYRYPLTRPSLSAVFFLSCHHAISEIYLLMLWLVKQATYKTENNKQMWWSDTSVSLIYSLILCFAA